MRAENSACLPNLFPAAAWTGLKASTGSGNAAANGGTATGGGYSEAEVNPRKRKKRGHDGKGAVGDEQYDKKMAFMRSNSGRLDSDVVWHSTPTQRLFHEAGLPTVHTSSLPIRISSVSACHAASVCCTPHLLFTATPPSPRPGCDSAGLLPTGSRVLTFACAQLGGQLLRR